MEHKHPSSFDSVATACQELGKELRVARTNVKTGSIEPEEVIRLVDKDTCLSTNGP